MQLGLDLNPKVLAEEGEGKDDRGDTQDRRVLVLVLVSVVLSNTEANTSQRE